MVFEKSGFGECALLPVFVPGEHANVPSFRSECTLVLVFVPGEHPPKPPFWKTTLFVNPRLMSEYQGYALRDDFVLFIVCRNRVLISDIKFLL